MLRWEFWSSFKMKSKDDVEKIKMFYALMETKRNEHGYIAHLAMYIMNQGACTQTHIKKVHRYSVVTKHQTIDLNIYISVWYQVWFGVRTLYQCAYICFSNPFFNHRHLMCKIKLYFHWMRWQRCTVVRSFIHLISQSFYTKKKTKLYLSTSNVKGKISTNKSRTQKRKTYLHRFKSWRQPKKNTHTHTQPIPSYR